MIKMHNKTLFNDFLPITRKEVFYTATIFPAIVCYQNFQHIGIFLDMIEGANIELSKEVECHETMQLLTEYNLKESANYSGKYFSDVPESGDTPDIILLITKPEPTLIVIEAKMFSNVTAASFNKQIKAQKKVVDCIKNNLNIKDENVFHIGLVSNKTFSLPAKVKCQLIFWEDIIKEYSKILRDNYFFKSLEFALDNFDKLNSVSQSSGKNMDEKLTGIEILSKHKEEKVRFWVGRNLGLNGKCLKEDKRINRWKIFKYEVNYSSLKVPNRNWFSSEEFVNFIEE